MTNEILETKKYDIFKTLKSNRKLKRPHIDMLKVSIQSNNMLKWEPIIVNGNMEVMDGQHRLQAAKELNLPIYYIINSTITDNDIIQLNNVVHAWRFDDYLNHFVERGFPEYIKLKNLIETYKINKAHALNLFAKADSESHKKFKVGEYVCLDIEEIEDVMNKFVKILNFLNEKLDYSQKNYINTKVFQISLYKFLQFEEVDFKIFFHKLQQRLPFLYQCAKATQYYKLYETIYNFKNSNPISVC